MDIPNDPLDPPQSWVAVLAESKAAAERGEVVALEPVLDRARAAIARIEARLAADHPADS